MKQLLLGNQAIARGAYEAGVKVCTAYPGTPSTEITEAISKYDDVYCEWSPNEKVALEVGIGAAIAGARAMVCMKHVGLNVAADPLFTVSYTGVNAGLVIVVADDPGMHSSQNEQDSRYYARSAHVPMLEPASSQEAKEYVKMAFDISEKFDTPVLLRLTTRISHSQGIVDIGDKNNIELKEYKKDAQKYVMMPAMAKKRHVVVEERMNKLQSFADQLDINTIESTDNKVGIITSGIAYQYVKEAMDDISVLKLGMVHPLPKKLINDFVQKFEKVYIIEELEPLFEEQIKSWGLDVIGKELFSRQGEMSSEIIKEKIIGEKSQALIDKGQLPARPPVMCPGCPHRGIFYVLNKLKLIVTGDIGCYTLGTLPPLQAIDTCICMGASVGTALGMEKARGRDFGKKVVAVIGDSTFIHSGITGLIDVVYNKGNSTVIILDNSTTGMTGHQDNPATGKTIKDEATYKLDLEKLVNAIGVERVRVIDPFNIHQAEKIIKEEVNSDQPSVIISRRPCALLEKRKNVQGYTIDNEKCKRCKACLKLGCPAIANKNGRMVIDPALCNGCGLCVSVCKFDAITKAGETDGQNK
ncbi:MAG: indolepyruvate ferredoxin oxidoreductase subunit alpha [Clostridia bacterium]|nr:indolepyruvate ferredoxin oxidoreductase subunit alpha [Clostridia bacterium]